MARQELHSDKLPIDQKPPIAADPETYDGEIVVGEKIATADYLSDLAFMEEPVTIRLEPSSEKNALQSFPIWVNGKMAEVFQGGRWEEIGYLPVGRTLIVKRKVLEVIIRAKTDTIQTKILDEGGERASCSGQLLGRSVERACHRKNDLGTAQAGHASPHTPVS